MRKSMLQADTDHENTIYSIRMHQKLPFFINGHLTLCVCVCVCVCMCVCVSVRCVRVCTLLHCMCVWVPGGQV